MSRNISAHFVYAIVICQQQNAEKKKKKNDFFCFIRKKTLILCPNSYFLKK